MQAIIIGAGVLVGMALLYWGPRTDDLGEVPWSDEQADAATKATVRYLGAPYEHARRVEGLTTREQQRAADAVIVAAREARLEAARQAHRPVPFRQRKAG